MLEVREERAARQKVGQEASPSAIRDQPVHPNMRADLRLNKEGAGRNQQFASTGCLGWGAGLLADQRHGGLDGQGPTENQCH